MFNRRPLFLLVCLIVFALIQVPTESVAQDGKSQVQAFLESNSTQYADMAQTIWGLAELGYMEEQSAALLQGSLTAAARAEYLERVGPDFEYAPLVGDRSPPLDYRRNP
jgi:hypothetical protein